MWNVGIRQLKDRDLSRAIRRAQHGETILVTDRGVPVAKIVPVELTGPPPAIAELVERGEIEYRAPIWDHLAEPIDMLPGRKAVADYVRDQRR